MHFSIVVHVVLTLRFGPEAVFDEIRSGKFAHGEAEAQGEFESIINRLCNSRAAGLPCCSQLFHAVSGSKRASLSLNRRLAGTWDGDKCAPRASCRPQ